MHRLSAPSLPLAALLLMGACGGADRWHHAEELWRRRDPGAFAAWRALDAHTPEGAAAQARLTDADRHFRAGIALLAGGGAGARDELVAGFQRAPMDPALYLPLARACRERGLDERAAGLYRKFLQHQPDGPDASAARAELAALDPGLDGVFEAPAPAPRPLAPLAAGVLGLATLAVAAWAARRRARPQPLDHLAAQNPELHPAIAFLVGSLRHELLKHRLLAVTDAARALAGAAEEQPGHRAFLIARLYRGEPLAMAWAGHLSAFIRALGPRFDLERNDPAFRQAGRAIAELAALEAGIAAGSMPSAARLHRALERLAVFDRALGTLVARLRHATIDQALLADVVAQVRGERAAHDPAVEITVAEVPAGLCVEMYRLDLALVLRNVVRNAVGAAARGPEPRRVALDVRVDLEPTGDEAVRVRVRDSNPEPLPADLGHPAADRGLGLVLAALDRYDGALELAADAGDGYAKAVVVRLFRALDGAPDERVGAVA